MKAKYLLPALLGVAGLGLGAVFLFGGDGQELVLEGAMMSSAGPATYRVFRQGDVFVGEFTLPQSGDIVEVEGEFASADEAEAEVREALTSRGFFDAGR